MYETKKGKVSGDLRKIHNVELHDLHSSPDIFRMMKSRSSIWVEM
jgi:hypothetical protein